jgi:hypothetical protein
MVVEVAKVTAGRKAARDEADKQGYEQRHMLELQYIADALECIRAEMVGMQHIVGNIGKQFGKG